MKKFPEILSKTEEELTAEDVKSLKGLVSRAVPDGAWPTKGKSNNEIVLGGCITDGQIRQARAILRRLADEAQSTD